MLAMDENPSFLCPIIKQTVPPFYQIEDFSKAFCGVTNTSYEPVALAAILSISETYYDDTSAKKKESDVTKNEESDVTKNVMNISMPMQKNRHGLLCLSTSEMDRLRSLYGSRNNDKSGIKPSTSSDEEEEVADNKANSNESLVNLNIELKNISNTLSCAL